MSASLRYLWTRRKQNHFQPKYVEKRHENGLDLTQEAQSMAGK